MGPSRGHPFGGTEQGETGQFAEWHAAAHLEGLERGGHAVGHMWVEEGGGFGGDNEVDLAESIEGATACDSVDRSDHRLAQVAGRRPEVLTRVVEHERRGARTDVHRLAVLSGGGVRGRVAQRLVAVDAGAEGPVTGAGEDHGPHVVVTAQRTPQGAELPLHALR